MQDAAGEHCESSVGGLDALVGESLLGYSEKQGYKIQSSAGQEWERERRDLPVTPDKRSELVQEKLRIVKGGVKKIVAACPHCYNTLKNEYPAFGGKYEVVHHSQLIRELIGSGKLELRQQVKARVAWHDSCYLGRYHDIYDAPRDVVRAVPGAELVELPRNKSRGVCCGAGGARFWMEETIGERINVHRSKEVVATGADCVGSACPFCLTMLKDGVADLGNEEIKALDLVEIVAKAL